MAAYTSPNLSRKTFTNPTADSAQTVSDNALVQNQFNKITASDSPLMQMARTGAMQQMNERGLQNSSLAQSAGDLAAYQAALPIAERDAATYATADLNSHQFANQGGLVQQAANYDRVDAFNQGRIEGALAEQTYKNDSALEKLKHSNNMAIADEQFDQVAMSSLASSMAAILGDSDITDVVGARESLMSAIQTGLKW